MAAEIPEGLAIETIYVIEADYTPEAPQRRPAFRAEHLERIGRLRAGGTIVEAGGFADFSSALVFVRAPDAEAALALVADDVYTREGVWRPRRARPFGRVTRAEELAAKA